MSLRMIAKIEPGMSEMELKVMGWFAAGHEMLWIPICEVADGPAAMAEALAKAERLGGPRLIRGLADFGRLPLGIKGWLFPAHLDDTDVICVREAGVGVSLAHVRHPVTGQRVTYRYDTEAELGIGQ